MIITRINADKLCRVSYDVTVIPFKGGRTIHLNGVTHETRATVRHKWTSDKTERRYWWGVHL